mgnify:CR=1 FL=1
MQTVYKENTGAILIKEKLPYILLSISLSAAFRADSLDYIIDGMGLKSFRQFYHGHFDTWNTICLFAMLAIEMYVLVSDSMMLSLIHI